MIYLERRGQTLADEETTLGGPLGIVLDHHIIGGPDAVRVLWRRVGVDGSTTVPGERGEDDTVLELDLAIGDLEGLEELGRGPGS